MECQHYFISLVTNEQLAAVVGKKGGLALYPNLSL